MIVYGGININLAKFGEGRGGRGVVPKELGHIRFYMGDFFYISYDKDDWYIG